MKTRIVIYAEESKVLTDGKVFGKSIFLADGANINDFHEISEQEYNAIMAEMEET